MKTCSRCAAPNADEAASCSACGNRLTTSPSEAETVLRPQPAPPPGTAWSQPQPPPPGTAWNQPQPPPQGSGWNQAQPPGPGWGPPQAPGPRTPATTFKLDVQRWSTSDRVVGGATLVLFISLFLPWFTYGGDTVGDGLWHGYEFLTLIIALAIIAYLIMQAALPSMPFKLPVPHETLLLAATGVNLLLVLIGFIDRPSASAFFVTVTASWGFGAFLGLLAALAATAAAAGPIVAARNRR